MSIAVTRVASPPAAAAAPLESFTRVLLAAAAVLAYARLFVGVDVTDESFYNAVPHSFALGLHPYRDELNITQNGGILLAPFYWLHHAVFRSTTGLVLFNRHLYFLLVAWCSRLAFRVAAARLDRSFARLLAAFVLTFSYFNIPALSYNTLGGLFFFAGLWQMLLPSTAPRIFSATLCFVLAAFAHPALLSGAGVALAVAGAHTEFRRAWLAAAALGLLAAILFFAACGLEPIRESLAYARSYGYDLEASGARITEVLRVQARLLGPFLAGVTAVLALPFALPRRSRASPWIVGTAALLLLALLHRFASPARFPTAALPAMLAGGALLPLALLFLPDRTRARRLALTVALPCFAGAAGLACSSTNGLFASVLALFPAAATCLLVLGERAQDLGRTVAAVCGFAPLIAFQGISLLERTYRDAPFGSGATPAFGAGPFAGLITTEGNAQMLAAVRADLNSLAGEAQTLFVYDNYPAAYLLSPLRPRTFSAWIFWPGDPGLADELTRRVFAGGDPPPDVVLQVQPSAPRLAAELQRNGYRVRIARREFGYAILQRDLGSRPAP